MTTVKYIDIIIVIDNINDPERKIKQYKKLKLDTSFREFRQNNLKKC